MPWTYQATFKDNSKAKQAGTKRRKTLAEVLEPPELDPNRSSFDAKTNKYRLPANSTKHSKQNLPQLQFVVKYANRCRHESTIRHKGIDLQGNQTHIMPLNLTSQNSLYFVKDAGLTRLYDEAENVGTQVSQSSLQRGSVRAAASEERPEGDYQKAANDFVKITAGTALTYQALAKT